MALKFKKTSDINNQYVKILVYGHAGVGKTTLCKTLDNPFIASCEGGLLSLAGTDINYADITSEQDLEELISIIANAKNKKYETIVLDSITELADLILLPQKKIVRNAMQAYGYVGDAINRIVRLFSSLPYNIYMSCKAERAQDEDGTMLYSPSMPGNKLGQAMPYLFDEVLALRVSEEKDKDGNKIRTRYIQTDSDGKWHAKDRSGKLNMYEPPDLQNIINKCLGIKEVCDGVQSEVQDMEQEVKRDDISQ